MAAANPAPRIALFVDDYDKAHRAFDQLAANIAREMAKLTESLVNDHLGNKGDDATFDDDPAKRAALAAQVEALRDDWASVVTSRTQLELTRDIVVAASNVPDVARYADLIATRSAQTKLKDRVADKMRATAAIANKLQELDALVDKAAAAVAGRGRAAAASAATDIARASGAGAKRPRSGAAAAAVADGGADDIEVEEDEGTGRVTCPYLKKPMTEKYGGCLKK